LEDQRRLKEIFQRYINNECTQAEIEFLLGHFKTDSNESALREIIAEKLNEYPIEDIAQSPVKNQSFDELFNNILVKIANENSAEENEEIKPAPYRLIRRAILLQKPSALKPLFCPGAIKPY